jgi:hypothetical protein
MTFEDFDLYAILQTLGLSKEFTSERTLVILQELDLTSYNTTGCILIVTKQVCSLFDSSLPTAVRKGFCWLWGFWAPAGNKTKKQTRGALRLQSSQPTEWVSRRRRRASLNSYVIYEQNG